MKSVPLTWIVGIALTVACVSALAREATLPVPIAQAQYDDEQMIWTLGDQVWEFGDLSTAYLPAKGEFNPQTREAVWTMQIVRDMTPGEIGFHSTLAGSPFKPNLLDADKILVLGDARVKITPITGIKGDSVRVSIRLPDEAVLANIALIRLERRTEIGF